MSPKNNHNKKKSRRKWPWILLLSLVALVGLVRLSLMTAPVQNWVKNMVVDIANQQLNPELSIGKLSGDLWNSITLTNIQLKDDQTVASIDTLHLEYSPLSYFGDAFQIHEIQVIEPFIKFDQQADSTWNVQHWMNLSPDTAATDTTSTFAFSISNLLLKDGRIDVSAQHLQPDSSFVIDGMNIRGNMGMFQDGYEASIAALNFAIKDTPLEEPIAVNAAADASDQQITLEKLAMATGQSLLQATANANLRDSTIAAQADAKPLGWRDIAAVVDSMPVRKDLTMALNLEGNADRLDINFEANADGIDQLALSSTIRRDSAFTLTSFGATAGLVDLETFMGDTTMPRLRNMEIQAEGSIPLNQYQQGQMSGTISAVDINQSSYHVDRLQGNFDLEGGNANIRLEPVNNGDRLIADANLSRIWGETPSVSVAFRGASINPENWLPEQGYTGSLTFNGKVSGTGWYPEDNLWNYRLSVNKGRLNGQAVDRATFSGRFNQQMVTNQSQIAIAESNVQLQAEVRQLQTIPVFSYTVMADKVNVGDLSGMEEYQTSLTGTLEGKGQGNTLENLDMQTSVRLDSSLFMGEFIENLTADVQIDSSIATINTMSLSSGIADGSASGRLYLQDFYDTKSSINLNLEIKDLSSFASVAGVEILQATGTVKGALKPIGQDSLVFDGDIYMQNVNYNDQFLASQIDGSVWVALEELPQYRVDVDINEPVISSVSFQNIGLQTEGKRTDTTTSGSYQVALTGANEGRIDQAGSYRVSDDSISIEMATFDLTSSLRTLSLRGPFHATYAGGALQTDTLHISSNDGSAFLELAVPFADTLHQKAYWQAKDLNLSVMQDAILNETLIKGLLSGNIEVDRTDTSLTASGDILMSDLVYQKTELDTLQFSTEIANERLTGTVELHQGGERIVEGAADIPFKAENLTDLDDGFFNEAVSGHLRLNEIQLSRFSKLFEEAGYEDTDGTLQFNGQLKGRAGQPELNAKLSLKNARLSGVPIDSLIANVNYEHQKSNLNLDATLTSLKQKAIVADAGMPLDVNLRTLDVALPGPQDSVSVAIKANEFNLKALNDFLDPAMARNLEGRINGNVDITGPRSDPKTSGQLNLSKGAVRVVTAGIRLDNIGSTILFTPDEIVLDNLRMKSGSGSFNASGSLALEQLVPGDLNISMKAENFKAANTDEYNAIIAMDMNVNGSVDRPEISGNIDVVNGFVELDNFGEKSVEQVELDTTLAPETETSLYDSLGLDLDLEFNNRFYVRNQRYLEMEIELDGQLDILKETGNDLQLFGTLSTSDGYAQPLGKRFELEEGSLAFSGPPDNPQINIRTLYEPPQADQEIKIWYTIEGTVEDPQFKYESEPPMDLAGIISYTLFGQPFYKLNPAEQSVASSSSNNAAADLAVEVLLDRVESIATKRLGIDVVRIEQTRVGGDSGTSVTTGWYINPKVFFAIQNVITGSTPTTGFYLEYYLQKNLKLILSQGNDNRQGVDVQWEYDY